MTHSSPMHALFVALVAGCQAPPPPGGETTDPGSTSIATNTGPGATATVTGYDGDSTGGESASTTDLTTAIADGSTTHAGTTTTGAESTSDCEPQYGELVGTVLLSQIIEWVYANGYVWDCNQACNAANLDSPSHLGFGECYVSHPDWPFPGLTGGSTGTGVGSDTGTDTGLADAGTTAATGSLEDPEVDLVCHWYTLCGRGHAGLRSHGHSTARDPVGRWAAKAAHAEAASVPAFVHLSRELAAHGAPDSLCKQARRAAADEVIHARLMSRMATERGAAVPQPRVESIPIRALESIAIENAVEGCVRETWAALEATHQAVHARNPEVRRAMGRIAVDEVRHAELARQVDAWCRSRLDDEARARVDDARARAVEDLRTRVGAVSPDLAAATGLPAGVSARRLFDRLAAAMWAHSVPARASGTACSRSVVS